MVGDIGAPVFRASPPVNGISRTKALVGIAVNGTHLTPRGSTVIVTPISTLREWILDIFRPQVSNKASSLFGKVPRHGTSQSYLGQSQFRAKMLEYELESLQHCPCFPACRRHGSVASEIDIQALSALVEVGTVNALA